MAANMDGVGTFTMATKLAEQKIFTCLVKTYSVSELVDFFDDPVTQNATIMLLIQWGLQMRIHQKFRSLRTST